MKNFKNYTPHLLALLTFIIVALAYFYPVLSGKEIMQSDIVQYTGMAKEQNDFRNTQQSETYWTNGAFGGMPTYQLGAQYPHNYIKKLDHTLRFLPRPADYLFLYFIGFYILLVCLKIRPLKAVIGALIFGFSTYLIVIMGAGHNAKAHAIAYMPLVIAGVLLVFRKRYVSGGLLTMVAAALEINANHFQMTYYLLLFLAVMTVYFIIDFVKKKELKQLAIAFTVFAVAGLFAIGSNATNLLATQEYAAFSTRSKSDLAINADGSPKTSDNAMSHEYITEYSYGIFETFNLFVPRLTGGGNNENIGIESHTAQFLTTIGASPAEAADFAKHAPTYWGSQPIVAAPAYIGAVVIFLFILSLFTEKRKIKYIFIGGIVFSILLSWGHHFFLTDFMIDYFPMYNKFRAITSIQVIAEICFPVLAVLGLQSFFQLTRDEKLNALKKAGGITAGLLVILFIAKSFVSFSSDNDQYYMQMFGEMAPSFIQALAEDRSAMYTADLLRTALYVLATGGVLYFFTVQKLKAQTTVLIIGALAVIDLVSLDINYVNKDNFVAAHLVKNPFQLTPADEVIRKDPSNFRVFDVKGGFSSGRASFFHHSLGGYHAAKPKKIQELYDYHLSKNNVEILNMLNVKYIINTDEQQQPVALTNQEANGNAWFVSEVQKVASPDEAIKALGNITTKKTAVIETKKADNQIKDHYTTDSIAFIKTISYLSNKIVYETNNPNEGLAVFSEIYYPKGWKATVDGKEASIYEVDYTLRAIRVPEGRHTVIFEFDPEVVKTGSRIALFSFIGMVLLLAGGAVYMIRSGKRNK